MSSGFDLSGTEISLDISGSGVYDASGNVLSVSGPPPPPVPIYLSDILSAVEVITQKEAHDRNALEAIRWISSESLRSSLVQWAIAGFPNAWVFSTIPMIPPSFCSDGVKRSLPDYVTFLMGQPMSELIVPLQARLPDVVISFATTGPDILLVVSKQSES
jgi:hypothetical protein